MTMTDPIADLLTRIRNALTEKQDKVEIPASRIKANVVRVLKEEGYVRNFRLMRDERGHPVIKVFLKYTERGDSVIQGIRRVSTPGLRRYARHDKMPRPLAGEDGPENTPDIRYRSRDGVAKTGLSPARARLSPAGKATPRKEGLPATLRLFHRPGT